MYVFGVCVLMCISQQENGVGFGIYDALEIMFCTCSMLIYYTEIYIYHKKTQVMCYTPVTRKAVRNTRMCCFVIRIQKTIKTSGQVTMLCKCGKFQTFS